MEILRVGKIRKYTTIMSAVDAASVGDVVLIDEGIYTESIKITKAIHIVGNTLYPGKGQVILAGFDDASNGWDTTLYFQNISGSYTMYFENIHISPMNWPVGDIDECFFIVNSWDIDFVFNRCIFDSGRNNVFLFKGYNSSVNSITMNNCRGIFKEVIDYPSSGPQHFNNGLRYVLQYFNKCIFNTQIDFSHQYVPVPSVSDYVIDRDQYGYGPHYGTNANLFNLYYFKGTVTSEVPSSTLVDNVVLDKFIKLPEIVVSNNDLTATVSKNNAYVDYAVRTTVGRSDGKWYWEVIMNSVYQYSKDRCGISLVTASINQSIGDTVYSWGFAPTTGKFYYNGVCISTVDPCFPGDIIGIALDMFNGNVWFSKNGTWMLNGDPSLGVNPVFTDIKGVVYPSISLYSNEFYDSSADIVFAIPDLTYTIPTGFNFYGTSTIWRVKCISAVTNEVLGSTLSDALTQEYFLETTYSGEHFVICEDVTEVPEYNDLILGRMIPKELI